MNQSFPSCETEDGSVILVLVLSKSWKQQMSLANRFTTIWASRQAVEDLKWCLLAHAKIPTEKYYQLYRGKLPRAICKGRTLGWESGRLYFYPPSVTYSCEFGQATSHSVALSGESDSYLSQCSSESLARSRCSANQCWMTALPGVRCELLMAHRTEKGWLRGWKIKYTGWTLAFHFNDTILWPGIPSPFPSNHFFFFWLWWKF